jgi:signal transduction histidine kinase
VVDEVVSLAQHQVDDRVRLETAVPQDLVWTLPEAGFRHALLNLVLNAAQALQESGGTVRVEAGMEGGELAVIVSDDGPGFPDALLSAGVHEFGSWRSGGTGLGLATVRRFAFANAGRLQLGNRPQGGARATLLLPAAAAAAAAR